MAKLDYTSKPLINTVPGHQSILPFLIILYLLYYILNFSLRIAKFSTFVHLLVVNYLISELPKY